MIFSVCLHILACVCFPCGHTLHRTKKHLSYATCCESQQFRMTRVTCGVLGMGILSKAAFIAMSGESKQKGWEVCHFFQPEMSSWLGFMRDPASENG